jgi:hypothetical protein
MKFTVTLIALFISVLGACNPSAQQLPPTPTIGPTSTTSSPSMPLPVTPLPTNSPESTPKPGNFQNSSRLDPAAAEQLLQAQYRQDTGPIEIGSIQEITPKEVWEALGAQIFQVQESGASIYQSYLIRDQQAWPLHTGFDGFGVKEQDLIIADLDYDGQPELVYAFALESEIGQFMRLAVFHLLDGVGSPLELDWTYQGELDLQKAEDGKVLVLGKLIRESKQNSLGYLDLQGGVLSLTLDLNQPGALATYTNQRFGISFQYPATWQPVGDDHYQGVDGFFQITPYASIASGLSDDYHRFSFRMLRACTWEVNASSSRYGQKPEVHLLNDVPGTARCQILPGEGAEQDYPTLLLETADGDLAILQANLSQLELVDQTLEYHFPDGQNPHHLEIPSTGQNITPQLALETRQLNDLTLEEYRLFPQNQATPYEEELSGALRSVRARRDPWRQSPEMSSGPERLAYTNTILGQFGYHLEADQPTQEDPSLQLYLNGDLIKENLDPVLLPLALSEDDGSLLDFAQVVEERFPTGSNPPGQFWLIRKDGLKPWDPFSHRFTRTPVLAGSKLVDLKFENEVGPSRIWIEIDGKPAFSMLLILDEPGDRLSGWDDHWVLEVDGTLVIDGQLMNLEWGYGEIFNWFLLEGKPFFFFEKGGQVSISYDGQELPVSYDEIIHAGCCGGYQNPRSSEHMVSFYARRDGWWTYVEIGEYD